MPDDWARSRTDVQGVWLVQKSVGLAPLVLSLISVPALPLIVLAMATPPFDPQGYPSAIILALIGLAAAIASYDSFSRGHDPARGQARMLLPRRLQDRDAAMELAAAALRAAGFAPAPWSNRVMVTWPLVKDDGLKLVFVMRMPGAKGDAGMPPRFDLYGRGMENLDAFLRVKKELRAAVKAGSASAAAW